VAAEDHLGPLRGEVLDGRQGRHDTGIVGNRSVFERHIKIAADKHALARQVYLFDGFRSHRSLIKWKYEPV